LRKKDKELTELKLKQLEQTKLSMLRTSASDIDRRTKHLKDENTYLKEQIIEKDNRILRLQSSHDA